MKQFDWSRPQRQPMAGLAIVFLDTFWELLKRLWPLLLLMLFGENKEGKVDRYEIMAMGFLAFTIIGAVLRFIHFRFYIEEDKLVIKKGWFSKITKVVPLQKIHTVNIEQGPLHQVLNIVKLSIDTAGSQKAEATIDALHKPMAEALKAQLMAVSKEEATEEAKKMERSEPIIRLSGKDLLKLSISANHLETFFLFLAFGIGLYDNLKVVNQFIFSGIENLLPERAIYPILFLTIAILLVTILLSTARIFFRFYNFTVLATSKGFQIKSGLFNIKERLIAFQKIQFVSWRANWIRKLFGLWLLEYHVAGGDEIKQNQKVQLPVTQAAYIPLLVKDYNSLPQISSEVVVRIHPSFVWRRLFIFGLAPCVFIMPLLWLIFQQWTFLFLFLFYPLLILIVAWCTQKKFRLWALQDVVYIKKGVLGEERALLQWHKLQSVQISQSIYQRKNNLANLKIYTAGGNISIQFIPLQAARQLVNFALYKTEALNKGWL